MNFGECQQVHEVLKRNPIILKAEIGLSMHEYRSFVKDNLLVLSGHILIYLQGIILIPIIIKSVGVTIYGGYILLISAIGFLFGISSLGVSFRCKRYLPSSLDFKSRRELFYPQLFWQAAVILCSSLIIIFSRGFINNWLLYNKIKFVILLAPLSLWINMLYSQAADYFRYTGRVNYFNYATVAQPYINIGIILFFLYSFHNLNVDLLISAQIFSMILICIPLIFKICREIGFYLPVIRIVDLAADMKLGFPLILVYLTNFIMRTSDRYIIAFFISVTAVGYYNPAYTLGSLMIFFPMVSGVVLPPLVSKAFDSGKEVEARIMINYTVKGFLLLSIPFVVGSYVMSKQLLILLTNYEVAENAYLIVPVVAMGTIFYGLIVILSNVLFVKMKTNVTLCANIIGAIINLVLNLVLFYIVRDIMIAALSALVSFVVAFIFIYRNINRFWEIHFDIKVIMKSIVASILMMISLILFSLFFQNNNRLVYILGGTMLGSIVYLFFLFIFRVFSTKELAYIKGVLLHGR